MALKFACVSFTCFLGKSYKAVLSANALLYELERKRVALTLCKF